MKAYVYKGWLGDWFVLFQDNTRSKFNSWQEAISEAFKR